MTIIEEFITWLEAERRYSPLTVRNYRRDIDDFLAWQGIEHATFNPESITRAEIEDWAEYLFERRRLKASSVNRSIATLRTFWHWMRTRNYTSKDITSTLHNFKQSRRLPVFVPDSRMEEVITAVKEGLASEEFERVRDALIVVLLYTTGLRLAELCNARMEDVAADFSTIRVVGKGDKQRIQPIPEVVGWMIKKYFSQIFSQNICTGQKKALILSQKGEPISQRTVQRIVNRVLKGAGVQGRTSPHVLRHTFATHLLTMGSDLREIQELLGHSSLRATQVYTHLDIRKLREVYGSAHPRGNGDTAESYDAEPKE